MWPTTTSSPMSVGPSAVAVWMIVPSWTLLARADADVVYVAAQDAVEPDARLGPEHDVADHAAAGRDEGVWRHLGPAVVVGQEQAGGHALPTL